jgi:hypothetical protein
MRATVIGGGGLQYVVTAAAVAALARGFGLAWPEAVAWGLAVGLSSTALVIWLLEDRGGEIRPNPAPDLELRAGDVLLVYGTGEQLSSVRELLA